MAGHASDSQESAIGRRRSVALREGQREYKAKRAAIIRVAAEVFKDKGFQAATLNDVAERFGVDRASLYYYVGSKGELFREAVQGVTDANVAKGEEVLRLDVSARQRLQILAVHLLASYEENYPFAHVYTQEDMRRVEQESTDWTRQMARQIRRLQAIVVQLVSEGIEEGNFRRDIRTDLAANAYFGMLNWTHRWFKPTRELSAREVADAFCLIFFDGLTLRGADAATVADAT